MNTSTFIQNLRNYCNVLRDHGTSYDDHAWPRLLALAGDALFDHYRHTLQSLGNEIGTLGLNFDKSQSKFLISEAR